MSDVIEINVSVEDLAKRKERIEKTKRFEEPDRVPVLPAIAHRYLIPHSGVSFKDYYSDPEAMLRGQIHAQKWLLENVKTDAYSITGAWVGAWTDFQNTFEAGSLGCEVVFPDDDIPWVDAKGWVRTDEDLEKLKEMDFVNGGINGKQLEFRERMIDVAEKYPVKFLGGEVFYPGENPALTNTSDGPFGVAGDLYGQAELFESVYDRPEFVDKLMGIVTDKMIEYLDNCYRVMGIDESPRDFSWTDDLAVSLPPSLYRDLVLEHEKRLRFHFDGRASMHMCGKSDHLLTIFRDDLKIDELQGFGYQVDLDFIGQTLGGKVVLIGNVNPMTVHSGTPNDVFEETKVAIEKLKDYRGFIVQDGNNIPPGTPVENINAMMAAAEKYGGY